MYIYQFSWKGISIYMHTHTHLYINIHLITVLYETKWRHLEICADAPALLRFPFQPMLQHFISSNMDCTCSFLLVSHDQPLAEPWTSTMKNRAVSSTLLLHDYGATSSNTTISTFHGKLYMHSLIKL